MARPLEEPLEQHTDRSNRRGSSFWKRSGALATTIFTTIGMTMGGAAPAAANDGEHRSHAHAQLIDAGVLGLNAADVGVSEQNFLEYGGDPVNGTIDAALLEDGIALDLGNISLELLGEGIELGAVSSYAHTPTPYEATASAGAVAEDGSIDISGSEDDPYGYATLDLTNTLSQLGIDLDGAVDQLGLELGAVASTATANDGEIDSDYTVAGARLALDSPLVDDITTLLNDAVSGLDGNVNRILGENGPVQQTLNGLSFDEVDVSLPGFNLLNVDLGSPELQAQVGLAEITDGLLNEPLVSESGITTIDLNAGEIYVDLEAVHGQGLNDLDPNTPLLSGDELTQVTGEVSELLDELVDTLASALEEAIGQTSVTLTLAPDVSVLLGLVRGDVNISIDTTIAELLGSGNGVEEGDVSISGGLTALGIPLPLLDLLGALLEPILENVVPAVTQALEGGLGSTQTLVSDAVSNVLDPVLTGLSPVLDSLNDVASITINAQPDQGNLGEGSFSVSALSVDVLPNLENFEVVSLPLATSSVYAENSAEYNATITLDPTEGEAGEPIDVNGNDFVPGSTVTITVTDETGDPVGGSVTAEVDGEGTFTESWTIPEDTEFGNLTVDATDNDNPNINAQETLVVNETYDPVVTVDPETAQENTPVTITGSGYVPNSGVNVTLTDGDTTVGSVPGVPVEEDGTFETNWTVPANTPAVELTVTATDVSNTDITNSTTLTIEVDYDPSISVQPQLVAIGDTLTVNGDNFIPGSTVDVVITPEEGNALGTLADVGVADDGTFNATWEVPEEATPGTLSFTATDNSDPEVVATGTTQVQETVEYSPVVEVDPDSIEAGEIVAISGTGYPANSTVTIIITDAEENRVAQANGVGTNDEGAFETNWRVPSDTTPGELEVTATADINQEISDSTPLTIEVSYTPVVTVDPESAEAGEQVTVEGSDFVPGSRVTINITDSDGDDVDTVEDVAVGEDGTFTDENWTIPEGTDPGVLTVTATDDEENSGSTQLTVDPTYTPSVAVQPEAGEVGDEITITGEGYVPESAIDLSITNADGDDIATIVDVATDPEGNFTTDWTIVEGTTPGELTVTATDAEGNDASTELTVLVSYDPTVIVEPSEANPGDEVTIGGEGFVPDSDLTIEITDSEGSVGSIDGVTTDTDGNFADESWTVPEDTTAGELTVTVTDAEDNEASAGLTIEEPVVYDPSLTVQPESVPAGQSVDISGEGFVPDSMVSISISDADDVVIGTTPNVVADENGDFADVSWTVPSGMPSGALTATATDAEGNEASTDFTVEGVEYDPTVTVDPSEANPGEEVVIGGEGFVPQTPVTIEITDEGGNEVDRIDDVVTDENGGLSETWPIPADIEPGDLTVTVTDEAENSDEATLTVTEPDDADGTDGADVDADAADGDATDAVDADADAVDADGVDADIDAADTDAVDTDAADTDATDATTDTDAIDTDAADAADADATDGVDADGVDADGTDADATDGDIDDPIYEANVSVSPTEVEAGNTVTVTGDDFAPNSTVDVVIRDEEDTEIETLDGVQVNDDGAFTTEWQVPTDASAGTYTVTATDTEDPEITGSAQVNVTEADDSDVPDADAGDADATDADATDAADTDGADVDSTDSDGVDADAADGTDVDATDGDADAADADGTDADADATDTDAVDTDATDADGTDADGTDADAIDTDAVDSDAVDTDATDSADTDSDAVDAIDSPDAGDTDSADADATDGIDDGSEFDPVLTIDPDEVEAGEEVLIEGEDFAPGSTVIIEVTDENGSQIGETVEVTIDDDGRFSENWTVPEDTEPGQLTLHAEDNEDPEISVEETLSVIAPAADEGPELSVDPDRAEVGQEVTFTGSGYAPNSEITLEANPSIEGVTSDSEGEFEVDWVVTDELGIGEHVFTGTDELGGEAQTVLTVIETADTGAGDADDGDSDSSVSVDPDNANPGEEVTIVGDDFEPGETVIIEITDEDGNVIDTIDDVIADENGNFTVRWMIPEDMDPGVLTITVTDESGNSASAELTLTDPAGAAAGAADAGSDDGLASTGATTTIIATAFAVLLIAIGMALLIARRNNKVQELN